MHPNIFRPNPGSLREITVQSLRVRRSGTEVARLLTITIRHTAEEAWANFRLA